MSSAQPREQSVIVPACTCACQATLLHFHGSRIQETLRGRMHAKQSAHYMCTQPHPPCSSSATDAACLTPGCCCCREDVPDAHTLAVARMYLKQSKALPIQGPHMPPLEAYVGGPRRPLSRAERDLVRQFPGHDLGSGWLEPPKSAPLTRWRP